MRSSLTVLTAARSHDLTTVATLKDELGIKPSDKTKDARLKRAIYTATSQINAACGRPFGLETVRERFLLDDCDRVDFLVLTRTPVIGDITSVTIGTAAALTSDKFDLFDADQGLLRRAPNGGCWAGDIAVVYAGGYTLLDGIPDRIERACLMLAAECYNTMGRDLTIQSVNIPDVEQVTYAQNVDTGTAALPPLVRELLAQNLKVI